MKGTTAEDPASDATGADAGAGPAIAADGLTWRYGDTTAVDRLDLRVATGTVFGFLGPNGAGKTTTVRLLLGLLAPDAGRARVLGHDVRTAGHAIRARCGVLLEHDGLYDRMSGADNLEFYARVWGMEAERRARRSEQLLRRFGLWRRRGEPVREWSRGMRRKLAVARTLLHEPECLFLDEPTTGLDPAASRALRDDVAGLAEREEATVFVCTHDLAQAEEICDRIGVIQDGRLVAVGGPDELRRRMGRSRVEVEGRGLDDRIAGRVAEAPGVAEAILQDGVLRVGLEADADVGPLVALLVEEGVQVERVEPGRGSLEDVYLALTETS